MTDKESKRLYEMKWEAEALKELADSWDDREISSITFFEVTGISRRSVMVEFFIKHGLIDLIRKVADECEAEFEANRERLEAYEELWYKRRDISLAADNEVRALDKKMEEI